MINYRKEIANLGLGKRVKSARFNLVGHPIHYCVYVEGVLFGKAATRHLAFRNALENGKKYLGQLMLIKLESDNDTSN